jgi:glc operon protein GlcG
MTRLSAKLLFAASIALAPSIALAQQSGSPDVTTKRVLTLAGAQKAVEAAEREARQVGAPGVIAVADDGGWLIALVRMDNAPMLASVDLAAGKARSAAAFRKPTQALEEAINHGRTAQVTAPGYVQMQGGVPIVVDGQVVGAIGVSADTPAHDQQIAEAGARALRP